jgi:hypothetical protein
MRHTATVLLLLLLSAPVSVATGPDDVRQAAERFGRALQSGQVVGVRALLPPDGKVQLRLDKLGPERGLFSAGQVEALLSDFLAEGTVRAFDIRRVEFEKALALVHAEAVLDDRLGQPARVRLHLSFRPEDGRWVLREIRETAP